MLIYGFIKKNGNNGIQSLVLEESKCTNKKYFQLIDEGYECVLNNNFDSIETAYEVMEIGIVDDNNEELHAYRRCCSVCGKYGHVGKATGRIYNYSHEKWMVFNGYIDDQCANDHTLNLTWK